MAVPFRFTAVLDLSDAGGGFLGFGAGFFLLTGVLEVLVVVELFDNQLGNTRRLPVLPTDCVLNEEVVSGTGTVLSEAVSAAMIGFSSSFFLSSINSSSPVVLIFDVEVVVFGLSESSLLAFSAATAVEGRSPNSRSSMSSVFVSVCDEDEGMRGVTLDLVSSGAEVRSDDGGTRSTIGGVNGGLSLLSSSLETILKVNSPWGRREI